METQKGKICKSSNLVILENSDYSAGVDFGSSAQYILTSKIQPSWVWYRLRVPGPQRHVST